MPLFTKVHYTQIGCLGNMLLNDQKKHLILFTNNRACPPLVETSVHFAIA